MKAKVTIEFDVDTEESYGVTPTMEGVIEWVSAMIDGQADFPEQHSIAVKPTEE